MTKGFDCATPLTVAVTAAFRSQNFEFVARYLVPSGWKALSRKEAEIITEGGLQIVSVFETTANRPLDGREAGLNDGATALQLAIDIGQPAGSAIYFAVDFDATIAQMNTIADYIAAAAEATPGYYTGVYGSYAVIEEMYKRGVCSRFWQTYAWSGGKKSEVRNIYQYQNDITLNGINVDLNESYGKEGWWNTNEIPEEDEMNMPMKLEQWQWDMLYQVLGAAYNADQLSWEWMQKIVDKTLTVTELVFLNTVLDGRVDRGIKV
ncbi:DUF1906 domain-containing protein [Paenibacillus sp. FSL H7-0331]|uniref:DUF1906 domain-containing protein n=1 Tax=Paenibacillus sp. FSL H7-0331 TaxID=1920421 RepID=UPI00096BEDFB|nr:DUF1906 domain-containing protein [Paenibacillus sp. FSL H7-0331]OMF20534.1 hypothetical protein BK127_00290 [Paenibacillus sp. FSL H7-0331]